MLFHGPFSCLHVPTHPLCHERAKMWQWCIQLIQGQLHHQTEQFEHWSELISARKWPICRFFNALCVRHAPHIQRHTSNLLRHVRCIEYHVFSCNKTLFCCFFSLQIHDIFTFGVSFLFFCCKVLTQSIRITYMCLMGSESAISLSKCIESKSVQRGGFNVGGPAVLSCAVIGWLRERGISGPIRAQHGQACGI